MPGAEETGEGGKPRRGKQPCLSCEPPSSELFACPFGKRRLLEKPSLLNHPFQKRLKQINCELCRSLGTSRSSALPHVPIPQGGLIARSNFLAMEMFLVSFWWAGGSLPPKGGGQGPPCCSAKQKVLFCCMAQGVEEEEERREGWGWTQCALGTGSFLLMSGEPAIGSPAPGT